MPLLSSRTSTVAGARAASRRETGVSLRYAAAVLAVLAVGVATWVVLGHQRATDAWVQHTDDVLLRLASVLGDVVDSETAERGFVITGAPASLAPYEDARRRLGDDLDALRELLADNPAQVAELAGLDAQARAELAALTAIIARRDADPTAATAAVVAGDDRRRTDAIRAAVDRMRRAELELLAQREDAASANRRTLTALLLAGLASLLVGLTWAARSAQLARERSARDDFREQFLGIVGHDLRAPLTAISLEAQMLRQPQDGPAQRATGERILSGTQRMTRMVSQLLDVTRSRLGAGIPIARRPMELRAVVEAAVAELARAHPERITLVAPAAVPVDGDPDRLAQVVANLVGNAVAHGRGPVTVELACAPAPTLRVHNGGDPIPPADLARVFEAFRAGRGESEGLGLGLFIADEIVRGHDGALDVTSTAEAGTTFTVTLPPPDRREP